MLKKNIRTIRGLAGAMSVSALALGMSVSGSAVAQVSGAQATPGASVFYNSAAGGNNSNTFNSVNHAAGPYAPAASINITFSRHNLGSQNKIGSNHTTQVLQTGAVPGGDNAVIGTNQICVFCHTPHGFNTVQSGPLWNKQVNASSVYTVYNAGSNSSSTLDADAPVLGSVSLACLSCHDGTQAMDNMINGPGSGGMANGYDATLTSAVANTGSSTPGFSQGYIWGSGGNTGSGFAFMSQNGTNFGVTGTGTITGDSPALEGIDLGTDLSNDHPISVQYCGGGIPIDANSQSGVIGNMTGNGAGVTGTAAVYAAGTCRDRLFNLPTVRIISGQPEFWVDTNIIPDTDAISAGAASTGSAGANPITRDPLTIELYVTDGTTLALNNAKVTVSGVVQAGDCGTGNNGDNCGRGFIPVVAGASSVAGNQVSGFGVRTKQDLMLFTNNKGVVNSPSVECASCHDPHTPNNGTFLRVSNAGSGLCLSCHVK